MALTSITSLITSNIVTALGLIKTSSGYDFTPAAIEQERSLMVIDERYPFIEVSGPSVNVNTFEYTKGDEHILTYVISYRDRIDDTNFETDKPLPEQTANVIANIHKALMVDHTRGGYAITTRIKEYGYINYMSDTGENFEVFMSIEVQALIDSFNMTLNA